MPGSKPVRRVPFPMTKSCIPSLPTHSAPRVPARHAWDAARDAAWDAAGHGPARDAAAGIRAWKCVSLLVSALTSHCH